MTVEPDYCEKLTGGRVRAETLVEKSFEFLVVRKPNTSILGSFELPVIGRHFPEYEPTVKKKLGLLAPPSLPEASSSDPCFLCPDQL